MDQEVAPSLQVLAARHPPPELTEEKAVKLPVINPSGEPFKDYQWYYRIDLDIGIFGLHPAKIIMVQTEIHEPLMEGLKDELDQE